MQMELIDLKNAINELTSNFNAMATKLTDESHGH